MELYPLSAVGLFRAQKEDITSRKEFSLWNGTSQDTQLTPGMW